MKQASIRIILLAFVLLSGQLAAAPESARQTLPEPLTLNAALALADSGHPDIMLAHAALQRADSNLLEAASATNAEASLHARARFANTASESDDTFVDDHAVGLTLSKRLYDFGHTQARRSAAELTFAGHQSLLLNISAQHQVQIMSRYFDVILSDVEFVRDNEAMSMGFVRLDRVRERFDLGKTSEIDVALLSREYQQLRNRRNLSELRQRTSRSLLANALNRPGELSSELGMPVLPIIGNLPEVEDLQTQALQRNAGLLGVRKQLEAARRNIDAARRSDKPVIAAEFEAIVQTRKLSSRDDVRAGVRVEIPLYTGGRQRAAVAREQADFMRLQAEVRAQELHVSQAVLEAVLKIAALQVQQDEIKALEELRDLELERNRALYEMEVATDFGDAMARQIGAHLQLLETRFELFLERARLAVLLGEDPVSLLEH